MPPFVLGTFSIAGCTPFAAVVLNERVLALQAIPRILPSMGRYFVRKTTMIDLVEDWDRGFLALEEAVAALTTPQYVDAFQNLSVPVDLLHAHPPVAARQIFGVGANYQEHVIGMMIKSPWPGSEGMSPEERRHAAEELLDEKRKAGVPAVFTKLHTALAGASDRLVIPEMARQCDWEIELGVVLGKPARHVTAVEAMDRIVGYTILNDVSARGLQIHPDMKIAGPDWISCKSPPGFAPCGPYLVPSAFVPAPYGLRMTLALNGKIMQDGNTSDMIYRIDKVIEFLSSRIQLLPGDIISTGTPPGNGAFYGRFLQPGDVMEATIDGLGTQQVTCVKEIK
jgi:2,4-diketo-3-deoxy-L-fuconate hydrolase